VTGPALVPLDAARAELGIGRTTAYLLAKEAGELAPGLPLFRIRGRWYANRAQLDRFKSGEPVRVAS
jgi:hypothetical protein